MAARKKYVKEAAAAEEKTVKEAATKAEEKTVKAAAAKTEETTVKPAAKKAPAKKTALKETIVLQFAGREIDSADVVKKAKEYWTKELKNKAGDMKSVTIYLKPEENKAYFVINGDVTGSTEL